MAGIGVPEEFKEVIEVDMSQLPEGTAQPTVTKVGIAPPGAAGDGASVARGNRSSSLSTISDQICSADGLLALRRHLQTYSDDQAGWKLLAEMQACLGNYREACFCFEELVMISPGTAHYHCRLAECLASTGLPTDREAARRHAAVALETSRGRLPRALVLLTALGPGEAAAPSEACGDADAEVDVAFEVGSAALRNALDAVIAKAAPRASSSVPARGALICARALKLATDLDGDAGAATAAASKGGRRLGAQASPGAGGSPVDAEDMDED